MDAAPEELVLRDGILVEGVSVRTTNADEMDPARARIGGLWQRFFAEGPAAEAGADAVYGLYYQYESDGSGPYTLLVGRERASGTRVTPPFGRARILPGRYLVFRSRGELPAAVIAGWQEVWAFFGRPGGPPRAFTTDFELYDPRFPQEVRIHVALA